MILSYLFKPQRPTDFPTHPTRPIYRPVVSIAGSPDRSVGARIPRSRAALLFKGIMSN